MRLIAASPVDSKKVTVKRFAKVTVTWETTLKNKIGNIVIATLVILNMIVWLVFAPAYDGSDTFARRYTGEVLGSTVIILMSCSLFLTTRPKWVEPFFGGLDKMYIAHRRASTFAFLLLFAHLLVVPISVTDLRLGNYLAIISFTGIVAIVLITLAPRIPFLGKLTGNTYEGWKNLHRYIGIFFILGFVHSLTVKSLDALVAISWVQVFFIIGAVSYLYMEVFGRFFKKYLPYTVEAVNHPNTSTTEVLLHAKKDSIQKQRAGQFLFVRFPQDTILNESHPFTISSAPDEAVLRVTIKACGDYTRHLYSNLKAGMDAIVEGAYGLFDYKAGGEKQIWVAGGIGITPFLSFIRDIKGDLNHNVDLYYTVRHREEAIFVDEVELAAKKNPCLKVYVRYSSVDGSLAVDEIIKNADGNIRGHHVYMCGPLPMVQAFERKFIGSGVSTDHIHYEEFNFR